MPTPIANREWVTETCQALLEPDCQKRILFLYGESGIGKTTVLDRLLETIPKKIPKTRIDFRHNAFGVADVFYHCVCHLDQKPFTNFTKTVNALRESCSGETVSMSIKTLVDACVKRTFEQSHYALLARILRERFSLEELDDLCFELAEDWENIPSGGKAKKARELVMHFARRNLFPKLLDRILAKRPDIKKDDSPLKALGVYLESQSFQTSIKALIHNEDPVDRTRAINHLTKAWFQDLQEFDPVVFIALDTYEQAPTDVKKWIEENFINGISYCSKLRVLLVGQTKPDIYGTEWMYRCEQRELPGVTDAEHWLSYVNRLGRRIENPDPLSFLRTFCTTLKGHPGSIMQFIECLPTE